MMNLLALTSALGGEACRFDADYLSVCDSTNAVLLDRAEAGAPSGTVVIAATQTGGRGRQGRVWFSSPADSLTFSLLWRFSSGARPMGLSLAVGVAVCRALAMVGAGGTALKWPNDVMKEGRKLAGILVELLPGSRPAAVIGIGLNLRVPASSPETLLGVIAGLDLPVDPHHVLASLLRELRTVLDRFDQGGFASLRDDWCSLDIYRDAPVRLLSAYSQVRVGVCRGVDEDGALLFESDGKVERILSGELSLRPMP